MKLLCPVIDINQKQIVKQQILDKVVLVKALLVCHQEALDLEGSHLADHVYVVRAAARDQDIFQLCIVHNFKKLKTGNHLALGRRILKFKYRLTEILRLLKSRGKHDAFRIHDTHINSADHLEAVQSRLQHLV